MQLVATIQPSDSDTAQRRYSGSQRQDPAKLELRPVPGHAPMQPAAKTAPAATVTSTAPGCAPGLPPGATLSSTTLTVADDAQQEAIRFALQSAEY